MPNITITTSFEFNEDMVDQILVTAFDGAYGGSNYWAELEVLKKKNHPYGRNQMWDEVTILEREDGQRHYIDAERLATGLKKYIEEDRISEGHLADTIQSVATDFDAIDADIIVQLAVFGEVRYA